LVATVSAKKIVLKKNYFTNYLFLIDVDIADFAAHPSMATLRDRVIWMHVDLPGQQDNAPDLEIQYVKKIKIKNFFNLKNKNCCSKYPSLLELGEELSTVLEHFKIHQAVFFGEGAGANICMKFAMKHASECLGLILINPSGSSAGFLETIKDKVKKQNPEYFKF
jgi:pimeloyl-ACP methyl ester carboxylesterase